MQDRIFIDTNVLIYAYSETEPDKKDIAFTVLENHHVVISIQVINECIWTMNRKFGVDLEQLQVLSDRLWQKFEVVLLKKSSIDKALSIAMQYKFSYWDSLIIASAVENECDTLYTEDMQDGLVIDEKLKVVNPFKQEELQQG